MAQKREKKGKGLVAQLAHKKKAASFDAAFRCVSSKEKVAYASSAPVKISGLAFMTEASPPSRPSILPKYFGNSIPM